MWPRNFKKIMKCKKTTFKFYLMSCLKESVRKGKCTGGDKKQWREGKGMQKKIK